MFATILGLPDAAVGIILSLCAIAWFLKDLFESANGPVSRGIWDAFRRSK